MQVMVIGAGVVGLAIAREAALRGPRRDRRRGGRRDRHRHLLAQQRGDPRRPLLSDRQLARRCTAPRSRRMLYAYCDSHGIPHRKLGKLFIVTKDADIGQARGDLRAGADQRRRERAPCWRRAEAMRMEPALACVAAFHSAETGIIDSHRYMLALQGDLEDRGGVIAFNTPIERIARDGARLAGRVRRRRSPATLTVDAVVNSAGHGAQRARARDRRLSGRARAAARARQGQLLRPDRPVAVLPADLSGAGAGRARHPRHARSRRPHAVRPGRRMDRPR